MSQNGDRHTPGVDEVDLAQFDADYAETAAAEGELDEVPDGRYQAKVEQVEVTRSKAAGTLMVKWVMRILNESHRGRRLFKYTVITAKALPFLKRDLRICQVDLAKLSELPGQLHRLLGLTLEVSKKADGDYSRVYFERLLVNGSVGNGSTPPVAATNPDLPTL